MALVKHITLLIWAVISISSRSYGAPAVAGRSFARANQLLHDLGEELTALEQRESDNSLVRDFVRGLLSGALDTKDLRTAGLTGADQEIDRPDKPGVDNDLRTAGLTGADQGLIDRGPRPGADNEIRSHSALTGADKEIRATGFTGLTGADKEMSRPHPFSRWYNSRILADAEGDITREMDGDSTGVDSTDKAYEVERLLSILSDLKERHLEKKSASMDIPFP
jgi:hypothetical protein